MSRQLNNFHRQKDSIGAFLAPENGYRGSLERRGIQPKDHMMENRRGLRATEMKLRMKREEENAEEKPLYKLAQFREVSTRVYDNINNQQPSQTQFLARGQSEKRRDQLADRSRSMRAQMESQMQEDSGDRPETPRKSGIPRRDEGGAIVHHNADADFVARNRMEALNMKTRSNKDNQELESGIHDSYGRVPRYLEERKAQWQEQEAERRRRQPDPTCPPGMIAMPEAERLQTLEMLQVSREDALQQLRKMPFVIETPTQRKRQDYLEDKLREIDNALAIFSKPKVFVAKDR